MIHDREQELILSSVKAMRMHSDLKDATIESQQGIIEKLSTDLAESRVALGLAGQRIEELQATALRLAQKVDEK